ncbi:hypothetical protein B0H14DRAFT_3457644 [Mycena olivaceomarginata]|nr:hypothetical protein B0H14DRAFT_3457644 [Mycena olivaceomarginata]
MPLELMGRVLSAVKSWLTRSGASPLSLSVKNFPDTVATDPAAQLMKCLVKRSQRRNVPLELPLCWAQLVDLDLDCARCHRLQTCTLHVVHHDILPISFSIVALESMHTFCLFQSFGVPRLLEHVLMPHLCIFRLRHHRTNTSAVDPSFCLDALLGVSAELHTLDLFLDCIMPEKLLASFPAMDSITHLTLTGCSMVYRPWPAPIAVFDDNILRLLAETTSSGSGSIPRLCPSLESIRLETNGGYLRCGSSGLHREKNGFFGVDASPGRCSTYVLHSNLTFPPAWGSSFDIPTLKNTLRRLRVEFR